MRRKISPCVDGGTSGPVKRAQTGSEDPHWRERKFCTELTQEYEQRSDVDKFLLECAPHLGFFFTAGERIVFIISETSQVDLSSMTMVSLEDCLMVEDTRIGSVDVAMR